LVGVLFADILSINCAVFYKISHRCKKRASEGRTVKKRDFVPGALMLFGLLVFFLAPPIVLLDGYTLKDAGFGLFSISFFLGFLTLVARLSHRERK
jgi:energy-converting hydrogenase Eha subunit G